MLVKIYQLHLIFDIVLGKYEIIELENPHTQINFSLEFGTDTHICMFAGQ